MTQEERDEVRSELGYLPSECRIHIRFPDGEQHIYPLTEEDDVFAWDQLSDERGLDYWKRFWSLLTFGPPHTHDAMGYHYLGQWLEELHSVGAPAMMEDENAIFTVALEKWKP